MINKSVLITLSSAAIFLGGNSQEAPPAEQAEISMDAEDNDARASISDLDRQLFAAASGKDRGPIRDLLKDGANIDASDEYGRTPLMVAIQLSPKSAISKLLVQEGANVSIQDSTGNTAMHYAVRTIAGEPPKKLVNGRSIIKALLDAGAPPDRKNNAEQTPRDFLLNETEFSAIFKSFSKPELERRSRLGALEDGMLERGLLSARTYPSRKITFGRILDAAVSGQIGGGANQVVRRPASQSPARTQRSAATHAKQVPIQCGATTFENLTAAEGSAILYAINQDTRKRGSAMPAHCVQKVVATSKVPFRGNTLIKYRIYRQYPRGYKAGCLKPAPDQRKNYWDYYEHTTQCNSFIYAAGGRKPIEVGGVRYEDGETTI